MADKGRPIRLKDIGNIPNGFTLSRFFLAIPLPFLIMFGEWYYAVIWLWVASVTDYFDGKLARRFDQVTGMGEVLDIVIDRTITIPCIIAIIGGGLLPGDLFNYVVHMIFFMFLISGDIMVLIGIFLFARLKKKDPYLTYPSPPYTAKWLYAIQLLGLTLIIAPVPVITVSVILIAMIVYNAYAANIFFEKAKWIFFGKSPTK